MHKKKKAAIFSNNVPWLKEGHIVDRVFAMGRRKKIDELTDLYPVIISSDNFEEHEERLHDVEVVFSTWDMPFYTEKQVCKMPNLKVLFHAAGATRHFREPFEKCGVTVCSATAANGIPVAEFALSQILLAGAGYWRNSRECTNEQSTRMLNSYRGHGNYGGRVSIMGNGTISNYLQKFLSHHFLKVFVVPSQPKPSKDILKKAFSASFAIVNLFPDCDDNAGIFNGDLFRSMMEGSVFINVGRGRQVDEKDLIQVMKERPDLTALLDVQHPEPPLAGSELYSVPNILLSAHLAGSKSSELIRMADYMIDDFMRYEKNEPLLYEVMEHQL